jgi:CheY-like chemotaxis protein
VAPRIVLVADEDIDTRIILRTVLERQAFGVLEAATAEAALGLAGQHAIDLVILNHPMRAADGRTLVSHLRALDATRAVPILNLTSRVVPKYIDEAAAQGVTVSLPKPIDVENVLHVISQLTLRPLVHAI